MAKNTNKDEKKPKKSVEKKDKKTNKKKVEKEPTKQNPINDGGNKFRGVQKILGSYVKENDIKLGRLFNKKASELYRRTKDVNLKHIEQNIHDLYDMHLGISNIGRELNDSIDFYRFQEVLHDPNYDNIMIRVYFSDNGNEFSFNGYSMQVDDWYRANLYPYLRNNFNESPVARLVIDGTDKKTYVNYTVLTTKFINLKNDLKESEETFESQESLEKNEPFDVVEDNKKKKEKKKRLKHKVCLMHRNKHLHTTVCVCKVKPYCTKGIDSAELNYIK